jgi:uncharacterized protein YcfL
LTGFVVLLATSLFLTGCVVTSAYPYYREQDLVIDEALIGDWSVTTRSHSF